MWIVGFIPQIVISLILAVWFTDLRLKIKAQGFFKAVIYLPNVIMASAFAFLFYSLFSRGGAIYDLIKVPLLESVWGSRGVVGLINFILWYGNTTILLMAAIMGVDTSLYESAQIDGATSSQTFWKITIPLIKPIMSYVLVTSLIGGLQMYDVPALLTKDMGSPNGKLKTVVMIIQANKQGDIGKASALCVIIFIVSAIIGLALMFASADHDGKKKKKNSPSRHQLPEQAVCTADQKTGQYIACHSHRKIPYCRDSAARFHHPCCNSDSDQGEQRTRQIPCKHGIQHRITGAERGCRKTPSSRGRSFQKKGGKTQNSIIQQKILCKEKIQKDLIVQKNTPCAFCMV